MKRLVHVQAHRGASKERPENTVESVLLAAEIGVDSIEIDVQVLKDGTPILFHDFELPGQGYITSYTLEEVSQLSLLSEVLKSLKNPIPDSQSPLLDIELKYAHTQSKGPTREFILENVLSVVARESSERRVVYRSFDWEILKLLLKKHPECQVIPLVSEKEKNWDEILDWKTQWIAPSIQNLKSDWIEKAQAQNTKIMAYTANSIPEWERLITIGVEGITTDYPRELIQFLKTK